MKFRLVFPWAGGSMERILQPVMRWLQVSAEVLRPLRQEHKQLLLWRQQQHQRRPPVGFRGFGHNRSVRIRLADNRFTIAKQKEPISYGRQKAWPRPHKENCHLVWHFFFIFPVSRCVPVKMLQQRGEGTNVKGKSAALGVIRIGAVQPLDAAVPPDGYHHIDTPTSSSTFG